MDLLPRDADDFFLQTTGLSHSAFQEMLLGSSESYEKFDAMMNTYIALGNSKRLNHRMAFVRHVAFALPAPETIQAINRAFLTHQETFPAARFINMGAGSGIFCWLLQRAGIPREKLVAVDLPEDRKTQEFICCYWDDILRDESYTANPEDLLFVAWGYEQDEGDVLEVPLISCWTPIQRYIDVGGQYVMILGEGEGGVTTPCDAMKNVPGWKIVYELAVLPSCNPWGSDYLTVSVKSDTTH